MRRWSELQLKFNLPGFEELADEAAEEGISAETARQVSEAARLAFERPESEDVTAPAWVADYVRLRRLGWPWRVAAYIAWASSPKGSRWPRSVEALATQVLGLMGPRVIYTWRQKFPAIDATVAMMQAAPLWDHRADVFRALVANASDPDYKTFNDRKLFLEMTGDYTPRSQVQLGMSAKDLSELSDAELDELIGEDPAQHGGGKETGSGDMVLPSWRDPDLEG